MKTISLSNGQHALVDDADFDRVSAKKWYAKRAGKSTHYALSTNGIDKRGYPKIVRMHHFVLGVASVVDHKDGNGLNNQRDNLRPCAKFQNQGNLGTPAHNTSGYKGVYRHSNGRAWIANISQNNRCVYLGIFYDPVEAAKSYDEAARKYFGEFAKTNF